MHSSRPDLKSKFGQDHAQVFSAELYADREVSEPELQDMFRYHQNYGLCSGLELSPPAIPKERAFTTL